MIQQNAIQSSAANSEMHAEAAKLKRKKKIKRTVFITMAQVLLILFSVSYIFPLLWMISVSFQTEAEMMVANGFFQQIIPKIFHFENYAKVFDIVPFVTYFRNSAIVAAITVLATIVMSTLVAYAFARIRFPGKKAMVLIMLATMIMPSFILLVPTYKMYSTLGFLDTWLPLVLPSILGGGAGNIYLVMQFFQTVPKDLSEAAKIDGASHFRIWWQIMIPLCKPVIASVAIFAFLFSWNDFLNPLIYVNSPNLQTIALGLKAFLSQTSIQWGYFMAGSLMSMVPILIVFVFCQKYFVEGIKMSGIKS